MRTGQSQALEDPFKDFQPVLFSSTKVITCVLHADGFLVLGHDVDRYSPDNEIPVWDKYGFEKMQSFSGAMSQLNFWRQWIPDTQIKDMAFCKGTFLFK